jgi:hypothetical protein
MKPNLSFPLFALFGLTRGLGGIGAGLLLADRVAHKRRKKLGKVLFGIGAASTVPLIVAFVRRNRRLAKPAGVMDPMTEIYTPAMGTVDDAKVESPLQPDSPVLHH